MNYQLAFNSNAQNKEQSTFILSLSMSLYLYLS